MRIIIFIVFIMMIIIYINELKNISASFFQINYIKDVADINIKKHCNDIYCEAETGRFNIAKNSYKLLLPNDFYNTKTYYFMILLIIIIFYINTLYNLIKYNNLYYPYISNDGGTICITIIKNIPYIFAFLTLVLIIVTLVARYAPTETEGYRNYFNIDNPVVSDFDKVLNINGIYNYILLTIATIFLAYYFSTTMCNKYIYTYPLGANKMAIINQNMSMGYLIITILLTYLLLNIMNILLSFADNKYPKLNNNNYRDIITKNYKQVLNKNSELTKEKVLSGCYTYVFTESDVETAKTKGSNGYGHDIMYSKDKKEENNSYGITTAHNTVGAKNKIEAVLYRDIDYISNTDKANNYDIAASEIKVNYYFKYISPLIPHAKIATLTDGVSPTPNKRYQPFYNMNYELYKGDIHTLRNKDSFETIITKYKDNDAASYNAYYMIENIRIGLFNKDYDKDSKIIEKLFILFDYIDPAKNPQTQPAITPTPPTIKTKPDFKICYDALLDVLIYFCINEIIYWNEYKSKEIYDNENLNNYEYIESTISPDYEKHTILLNLIKYLKDQKANSEKITSDAMNNKTVSILKDNLIREIESYSRYDKDKSSNKDKKPFFGKEYNISSNITEVKENFTADISYGSSNTFYEQYFNISNNDVGANDIEYKLGNYFIKNIKFLIYFIIIIIIIAILLIIFLYRSESASLMTFSYDIMMPLLILLIFVIYIYLFMNFNTNYNLNVIYGLFDSSYKRDLNDMNNLIIPFIKLHSNRKDKYDSNYYDLYIITNVLASFLYSDDEYDKPKYKNIYHKNEKANIIYSKDETVDYNEFKKYYNDQFTIINEEFKEDFDIINSSNSNNDKNLRKLYSYITNNIKNRTLSTPAPYTIEDIKKPGFDYPEFVSSFKKYSDKIVNIILICLELFGNNKDAYIKNTFVKDNFYFEKDKSGNFIPHKFRFNKAVFDKNYENASQYIKIDNDIKIYISKGDKKEKIEGIVNNYMNILSLFQYNYILSDRYDTIIPGELKTEIEKYAKDRGIDEPKNYLHQYKNKRLISLISNTKGFDKAVDKKSFILANDTFKYSKPIPITIDKLKENNKITPVDAATITPNVAGLITAEIARKFTAKAVAALTPEAKNALTPEANKALDTSEPNYVIAVGDVMYVYTNIIETYNINVTNISDNYLENVVKTICYQVDNRDVIMNEEGGGGSSGSGSSGSGGAGTGTDIGRRKINNKNENAHDNQVNILHKANQCVSYDFATNYTANIIMLGIIYSIGLYNNKIF